MNKSQTNLLTIIIWVLALIGVIIFFFSTDEKTGGMVGTFVTYGLILTVVATGLALIFSVLNVFKDKDNLKQVLTGVGLLILILIISYVLSDSNAVLDATGTPFAGSEGSVSKWVGTGIWYAIILLVVSGGLFIWDMIKNTINH